MPLDGTYEPSTDTRSREQVELYERTDGAKGGTIQGLPVIILSMLGARSGSLRKIPLMRVEHEGTYAVVASLGGAPKHPLWYHNVVANSLVSLQDGAVVRDYVAREVDGDERALWWERAVEAFPPYAGYAVKTERVIPVFVLEPVVATDSEAADAGAAEPADDSSDIDDDLPYAAAEELQEHIEQSTELDDEIAEFWENARVSAGLGKIAVVGGLTVSAGVAPVAWGFGDNPELADQLLDLVLAGEKTATSTALVEFSEEDPIPAVGDLSIIVDGGGHPRALIRTTEVEVLPFSEVTEDFAAAEGEDDKSLESWREQHDLYFRRVLGLDTLPDDFQVVTERFELLFPKV